MKRLLEGYDYRINKFIYKMAEKPIILKNSKEKHMTTRQELYALSSDQILDKKGFVFKSYKSDKERINEVIKNKEILEKYYLKKNNEQKLKYLEKLKEIKFIQPSMHFKKRTDLEKIYDFFKKKHHLTVEQKLLYKQLIKMGLIEPNYIKHEYDEEYENRQIFGMNKFNSTNNIFENNNINYDIINNNSLSDEEKYKKILHDKILNERKSMLMKRKLLLNLGNKIKKITKLTFNQIEEDEFQKTYFKATENLSIFKTPTMNHKLFKAWSLEDLEHQNNINKSKKIFYKTISTNFSNYEKNKKKENEQIKKHQKDDIKNLKLNIIESNSKNFTIKKNNVKRNSNNLFSLTKYYENNYNKRKSNFNLMNEEKILKDFDINKEIMHINPLLFRLNFKNGLNSIQNKRNENQNSFSFDKMNALKKIAFENGEKENNITISKDRLDTYYEEYKKDDNIIIDGNFFNKFDTDKIAEKVLNKCNFNNKKINYKNMSGRHKLMFTNGLTVNEFGIKYGIVP